MEHNQGQSSQHLPLKKHKSLPQKSTHYATGEDMGAVKAVSDTLAHRKSKKKSKSKMSKVGLKQQEPVVPVAPVNQSDPDPEPVSISENEALVEDTQLDAESLKLLCFLAAEDFWETAWELCSTRLINEKAPELVAAELRDAWLGIVDMQWMDPEALSLSERICIPESVDEPPFPPKFDTWAHGALEVLPNKCRESIMDPFLREPLPWVLEKFMDQNNELLKRKKTFPKSYLRMLGSVSQAPSEIDQDSSRSKISSSIPLQRPSSPVPFTSDSFEDEDDSWSSATTAGGSFMSAVENGNYEIVSPPNSAASMVPAIKSEIPGSRSIEMLFQSKLPFDIVGASEMEYTTAGTGTVRRESGELMRSSQIVAFKLPNQSSSQAFKMMRDRRHKAKLEAATVCSDERLGESSMSIESGENLPTKSSVIARFTPSDTEQCEVEADEVESVTASEQALVN